jgi:hypothetical protein
VLDLGEGCATVAAHLLLGLLSVETPDYRQVLEIGAFDLFDRILQRGLGANVNYPPVYALGVFLKFIGQLEPKALSDEVARRAGDAKVALVDDLERSARANAGTAQSAALLTVACLDADRGELIDPAWISLVLRQQRFDGSWRGEPFFAAPNRGRSVTWYESAILTSAMCYDALVRSSGRA